MLFIYFLHKKQILANAYVLPGVISVLAAAAAREMGENGPLPEEALPNYTLVSGLPSYDDALQQWRAARVHRKSSVSKMAEAIQAAAAKSPPPAPLRRLSVLEFLLNYKGQKTVSTPRHVADVWTIDNYFSRQIFFHFVKKILINFYFRDNSSTKM